MKQVTCETFLEFQFISEPALSPDGRYTAFVVQKADRASNGYTGEVVLLDNQSGDTRTLTALSQVKTYTWADNNTILFPAVRDPHVKEKIQKGEVWTSYYSLAVDGGEAKELFTLPVKAGKLTPLGEDRYLLCASYDNNRAVLEGLPETEREKALAEWKENRFDVFEEVPFWSNGLGIVSRKRQRLYLYNHRSRELTPLTSPLFKVSGFKTDNKKVLYVGAEYEDVQPIKSGVYCYDLSSGETTCLIEPKNYLVKLFELYGDQAVLNLTDGEKYGNGQNGDFYAVDLQSGKMELLADHSHHCVGSTVTADSRLDGGLKSKIEGDTLYFTSTVNEYSYIETLDLKTKTGRILTEKGTVDSLDILNGKLVFVGFRGDQIGELYSWEEGKETQLTHLNDRLWKELSLVHPEYLPFTNSDGIEIQGWLMKPVNYVPGNRYPGILNIHGGPRLTFSDTFMHEMQLWANKGYFVFFCNPRGGEGRGNEFADIRKRFGTIDYNDLMEFTDHILKAYPDIDPDRLGVAGGSYGGFMTNWIIGHTDRFRAACSQRSIANWTSFEGTSDIGYYFSVSQTGASHVDDRELQWKQSPLQFANRATTPTLFIQGDQDYRCWQAEAFQMFTALKMHGVESRLCLLKGENHELSRSGKPLQRIKRLEEILSWFEGHLK